MSDFARSEVSDLRDLRNAAQLHPELNEALQRQEKHAQRTYRLLPKAINTGNTIFFDAALWDYLKRRGVDAPLGSSLFLEIMTGSLPRYFSELHSVLKPSNDDIRLRPPVTPIRPEQEQAQTKRCDLSLRNLIAKRIEERKRAGITSFIRDIERCLDLAAEWLGPDRDISTITTQEIRALRDDLSVLPPYWHTKLKASNIKDAADESITLGLTARNPQAFKLKVWNPIYAFFEWAEAEKYLTSNPAAGIKFSVKKKSSSAKKRDLFSPEELRKIFGGPIFRGAKSDKDWWVAGEVAIRDERFWVPLLGLYTGGRRSELCGLRVDDISSIDGVLSISIQEYFDEDGKLIRSLKTRESQRVVPVHPELLRLGFDRFVNQRRKEGHERLFDCEPARNFDAFGKWFSRYLKTVGIKTTRNCFHSFRHNMETAMGACIEDIAVRSAITGRTLNHSSSHYARYSSETLFREISKITYRGLDLSGLHLKSRTLEQNDTSS